ncbi:hypothetical protein H5P36_24530 [Bacillus sp. APMAM]|nr:hypothetical protein [Bacillus sp. APMAM]RTZ53250.1 hypothetical protein EKO25_24310 [Bacillus sp. SAJ1]
MKNSSLSEVGKRQAYKLKEAFPVLNVICLSLALLDIQTALTWTSEVQCKRIVHSLIGARMFPLLSPDKSYGYD